MTGRTLTIDGRARPLVSMTLTDVAYQGLTKLIHHPYAAPNTQPLYSGYGILPSISPVTYHSAKGLSQYLTQFATFNNHPSTFQDTRPAYISSTDPVPMPAARTVTQRHTDTPDTSPYNHEQNWMHYDIADQTHVCLLDGVVLDDPFANSPYLLVSPYRLDSWGTWCTFECNPDAYRQRPLVLDDQTLAYFATVAKWWRIPPRTIAFAGTAQHSKSTPARPRPLRSKGTNQVSSLCGAVLEAIGIGWLVHDELTSQAHTNRSKLERERRTARLMQPMPSAIRD